jgi:hypothetical protein
VLKVTHGPSLDPPVRRDKGCVVCKGERKMLEDPKGIYRVDRDPFCSTTCCKAYYHVAWDRDAKPV